MLNGFSGGFGQGGVKRYATANDLPLEGVKSGTMAHVEQNTQGEGALYLWTCEAPDVGQAMCGGWYKVATVNLAPTITTNLETLYRLPKDGSPLQISLSATDPEGLPIIWSSIASESATGVAVIEQTGSTFNISADPAAIASETPGDFTVTFKASDGTSFSVVSSSFLLSFVPGPSRYVVVTSTDATRMYIYDLATGAPVLTQPPAQLPANSAGSCVWSPDGSFLAMAGGNTEPLTIYDFSVQPPQKLTPLSGITDGFGVCVSFSPDSKYLAFGSTGTDKLAIIDLETMTFQKPDILSGFNMSRISSVAWSKSGILFASYTTTDYANEPGILAIQDAEVSPALVPFGAITNIPGSEQAGQSISIRYISEEEVVFVAHNAGANVSAFKIQEGMLISVAVNFSIPSTAYSIDISPDNKYALVSYNTAPYLSVFDISSGASYSASPADLPPAAPTRAKFSGDGSMVLVNGYSSPTAQPYIIFYEWDSANHLISKLPPPAQMPTNSAGAGAFSPGDTFLFS